MTPDLTYHCKYFFRENIKLPCSRVFENQKGSHASFSSQNHFLSLLFIITGLENHFCLRKLKELLVFLIQKHVIISCFCKHTLWAIRRERKLKTNSAGFFFLFIYFISHLSCKLNNNQQGLIDTYREARHHLKSPETWKEIQTKMLRGSASNCAISDTISNVSSEG